MRFNAKILGSPSELTTLAANVGAGALRTPFQSKVWLETWYDVLGQAHDCTPLPLAIHDAQSGQLAALMPMVSRQDGRFRAIEFTDLTVSDYNAPILGPAAPIDQRGAEAMLAAMRGVLPSADVLRMVKMPVQIDGRPNPFALLQAVRPSPYYGHLIEIETTWDDYLHSRGRKYRKEMGRSFRVLDTMGHRSFRCASDKDDALALYGELETMQCTRMRESGKPYILDREPYSRFYKEALAAGYDTGTVMIFCLSVDDEPVALIYGICDGTTFLLLRIANAGEAWKHCSLGRLVVAETVPYLIKRGIRRFDMTIGDYAFKRGFDPIAIPLVDVSIALSLRGYADVTPALVKSFVRENPRLQALAKRIRKAG